MRSLAVLLRPRIGMPLCLRQQQGHYSKSEPKQITENELAGCYAAPESMSNLQFLNVFGKSALHQNPRRMMGGTIQPAAQHHESQEINRRKRFHLEAQGSIMQFFTA